MSNPKRVWDSNKRAVRQGKEQVWLVDWEKVVNTNHWFAEATWTDVVYDSSWEVAQEPLQTYENWWSEDVPSVSSVTINRELSQTTWAIWDQISIYILCENAVTLMETYPVLEFVEVVEESWEWYNMIAKYNVVAEGTVTVGATDNVTWDSDSIQFTWYTPIEEYTVTIESNDDTMWSVDVNSVTVASWTTISAEWNILTIGVDVVTATAETWYEFSSWWELPATVTEDITITATFVAEPSPILPSEYQEVEYIQSTGTQYIDTWYEPNGTVWCDIKFRIIAPSTDDEAYWLWLWSTNDVRWGAGYRKGDYCWDGWFSYDPGTYALDTDSVGTCSNYSFTDTRTPYLFAQDEGSAGHVNWQVRVYYCQIYEGGDNATLVRNFVPCYRKSDDEIWMYDLVNGVFYTNDGTWTFLKGSDVTPE